MSGMEAASHIREEELRRNLPRVPICCISATNVNFNGTDTDNGFDIVSESFKESGMDDALPKPFHIEDLDAKLRDLLNLKGSPLI